MAKHAHRILLNQKKTWRCTLPGCNWFIHIGLAHILPGKLALCWECGEEFTLDERALADDQPKCGECRAKLDNGPSLDDISAFIDMKMKPKAPGVEDDSIEVYDPEDD